VAEAEEEEEEERVNQLDFPLGKADDVSNESGNAKSSLKAREAKEAK